MPADLSWIDGSVEDAAKLIADRAVATRALGGGVAPGEKPAWALDLEKAAAAAEKQADGLVDTVRGWGTQARDWVGGQIQSAVGDQVGGAVRDAVNSPGVRNAITGGLIGAGGGAALGLGANLLSSNKRKRPISNALFGGLLGGLGGAAVGGLAGSIGGAGTDRPVNGAALSKRISARDAEQRDAPNVSVDKVWTGLNNLNGAGLARGAVYGAAVPVGAEVAGRAAVRAFNPTTARQHVGANSVRSFLTFLTPAQQTGLAGLGANPTTAAVRTAVGGNFDPVRTAFRTSNNPVLAGVHGAGDDSLARAVTRGISHRVPVTPAFRPPLATMGTARRGLYGALVGTAIAGGRQGIDMATGDNASLRYLQDTANDLRERFPHIGTGAGADPRGTALRQQLAAAAARLNATQTNPLSQAEMAEMMRLFQGAGGEGGASLHDQFRNVELGIR